MRKTDRNQNALDSQLKQLDQDIVWSQKRKTELYYQILSNIDKKKPKAHFFNNFKFVPGFLLFSIILVAGVLFLSQNIFQEDSLLTGTDDITNEEPVLVGEQEVDINQSKENIQAVIEEEFNGQDETYKDLWEAAMEAQSNVTTQEEIDALQEEPIWKNYEKYMADTYSSYFTENGYENFLNNAPAFMYGSFDGNYEMTTSDINISQNENIPKMFQITFVVEYKNNGDDTLYYQFEGEAITSEEGKIKKLQFMDKDDLLAEMNNNNLN